jgi:hypothetical protein
MCIFLPMPLRISYGTGSYGVLIDVCLQWALTNFLCHILFIMYQHPSSKYHSYTELILI